MVTFLFSAYFVGHFVAIAMVSSLEVVIGEKHFFSYFFFLPYNGAKIAP